MNITVNLRIGSVRSHICCIQLLVTTITASRISITVDVSILLLFWYFAIYWFFTATAWYVIFQGIRFTLFQTDTAVMKTWIALTTVKMAWAVLRGWFIKATVVAVPIKKEKKSPFKLEATKKLLESKDVPWVFLSSKRTRSMLINYCRMRQTILSWRRVK